MPRGFHAGRTSTASLWLAITLAVPCLVASCTDDPANAAPAVRPLGNTERSGSDQRPGSDDRVSAGSLERAHPDSVASESSQPPAVGASSDATLIRAEVDELLGRFDGAITDLYADPLSAGDDRHRASQAWLEVVVAGSQLDREVRGRILAAARDDMMVRPAKGDTTSFVNTAIEVTTNADGSVTWTNCGYSPGVGVDLHDGHVIDAVRARTTGRGKAIRTESGDLVMAELWDDETELLGSAAPNPCTELRGEPTHESDPGPGGGPR